MGINLLFTFPSVQNSLEIAPLNRGISYNNSTRWVWSGSTIKIDTSCLLFKNFKTVLLLEKFLLPKLFDMIVHHETFTLHVKPFCVVLIVEF